MINTRKIVALMLVLAMSLSVLAGCNMEGDDEYTGPAPTLSIPSVNQDIAGVSNAQRYPLDCDKTFKVVTREADPNERDTFKGWNTITGVNANWVEMSGDSLSQVMAGGNMPDAICVSWGVDKEIIYEYGKAGKLVNFAEYLEYMPNFQKMLEKFPDALTNYLNIDGSFYSLPSQSAGLGSPPNILYVREDMVAEALFQC